MVVPTNGCVLMIYVWQIWLIVVFLSPHTSIPYYLTSDLETLSTQRVDPIEYFALLSRHLVLEISELGPLKGKIRLRTLLCSLDILSQEISELGPLKGKIRLSTLLCSLDILS